MSFLYCQLAWYIIVNIEYTKIILIGDNMFNQEKLKQALEQYISDFIKITWPNESYKWQAIKCFQNNWNIDAKDFISMLNSALEKTGNLLASSNSFPKGMLLELAKFDAEKVREMFRELFDENKSVYERIANFKENAEILRKQYRPGADNHYQTENTITTYLWLRYPNKYYIYKWLEIKNVAEFLESDYKFTKGHYTENLKNFFDFYNEMRDEIAKNKQLKKMLKTQLKDDCDIDEDLHTLTMDVGFYISRNLVGMKNVKQNQQDEIDLTNVTLYADKKNSDKQEQYWWLNANPKIWSAAAMGLEEQSYTLYNENGHKRRIFQNFLDAKIGDKVIFYESNPVKQVVALGEISAEQDGEKICVCKTEGLSVPVDYCTLKDCKELENMEYFTNAQGSLFKLSKSEYDFILDIIREENPIIKAVAVEKYSADDLLNEVYITKNKYEQICNVLKRKKNIILQGAPGVGKTFAARRIAYSIMGSKDDSRIKFVQFHQNYSYEDFIMGYKPDGDTFKLQNGIFYRFCQEAANHPDKEYFFIIDEINRGNLSKIFGELLMLIESDYRGEKIKMAYSGLDFSVPQNIYIIGMMNTADRSLAMIDYALRRRFSFFNIEPAFECDGFKHYVNSFKNETFDKLIDTIKELNREISNDLSLGKGFCIGHSYFCNLQKCDDVILKEIVEYDILPMLNEYWFDEKEKVEEWHNRLIGIIDANEK